MQNPNRTSANGSFSPQEHIAHGIKCGVSATDLAQAAVEAGGEVVTEKVIYKTDPKSRSKAACVNFVSFIILSLGTLFITGVMELRYIRSEDFYVQAIASLQDHITSLQTKLQEFSPDLNPEKLDADITQKKLPIGFAVKNRMITNQNPKPIIAKRMDGDELKILSFKQGESCAIDRGGKIQVIAKYKNEYLVRYFISDDNESKNLDDCPNMIIFYISDKELEESLKIWQKDKKWNESMRAKKAFTEKALEKLGKKF